jgi:hypothetical protein
MSTLIFDIETIGEPWEGLDEVTQSVLLRWVERVAKSEEEAELLPKRCDGRAWVFPAYRSIGGSWAI